MSALFNSERGRYHLNIAAEMAALGHNVTVFDQQKYDETGYEPSNDCPERVASVDHNKIVSPFSEEQYII